MAKVVSRFFNPQETKHVANGSYPWKEWTNGEIWEIEQGEDFVCSVDAMKIKLGVHAIKNGFFIMKQTDRCGHLRFQFRKYDEKIHKKKGNSRQYT